MARKTPIKPPMMPGKHGGQLMRGNPHPWGGRRPNEFYEFLDQQFRGEAFRKGIARIMRGEGRSKEPDRLMFDCARWAMERIYGKAPQVVQLEGGDPGRPIMLTNQERVKQIKALLGMK